MTSPTQRSLKHLREAGWHPEIVEHFNNFTKRRKDLFGFADLLAIKEGEIPLLVQVTSGSATSARIKKILNEPRAELALRAGFRIEVHGWRKLKSNRGRWTIKMAEVTLQDFKCHSKPSDTSQVLPA